MTQRSGRPGALERRASFFLFDRLAGGGVDPAAGESVGVAGAQEGGDRLVPLFGIERGGGIGAEALAPGEAIGGGPGIARGLGVGLLPEYMGQVAPELETVLKEAEGPVTKAYFVYPEELRHSQRVTVFRDFLLRKLSEQGFSYR